MSVASSRGKRHLVLGMKHERVDGIHDIDVIFQQPVALERVFFLLRLLRLVEPVYRYPTFDRRCGVAKVVGHTCHAAGHEFHG